MNNIMLTTDSYKFSHYKQYPPGTEHVYSYLESRGGKFKETVFFGLQILLDKYLAGRVVTKDKVAYATDRVNKHLGPNSFNKEGWDYILKEHGGKLPISIKAVEEGSVVNTGNVLMTVENTDEKCYWLTNYLETLLVQCWYPSTVATQSREMKRILLNYLEETGTPSEINFKLHDFGYRGVSSKETAGIGGCAHLVNFKGSDNFEGVEYCYKYYDEDMAGFSIPASEHSTITSWGKTRECEAFKNMLEQYPNQTFACVIDSYDIYKACEEYWGGSLKDLVMERDERDCHCILRPDSGDPLEVLPKVLDILWDKFGGSTIKGYKVLDKHVRVLQGDGICLESMRDILSVLKSHNWSADNIAFGSGGGLLQQVNRDTCSFAMKCSAIKVKGIWRDVYKEPITDLNKSSKRGKLKLVKEDEVYYTKRSPAHDNNFNELKEVFRNGEITKRYSFADIRERAQV